MSGEEVHRFLAVDRTLSEKEMAALRKISTRASITETTFKNTYHYGSLRANPEALLKKYFDVYLYGSTYGERRLMLRLPAASVDEKRLRPYFSTEGSATLKRSGAWFIVDLHAVYDDGGDWADNERLPSLRRLASVRAALLAGDLRVAYLCWLLELQNGLAGDEETTREPPVPAGLDDLPGPLAALADLLWLDDHLISAAAEGAPGKASGGSESKQFKQWVLELPAAEKDAWLARAVARPGEALGESLLASFRAQQTRVHEKGRTAAELCARARVLAGIEREQDELAEAREQARAAAARREHLERLFAEGPAAFERLAEKIAERGSPHALPLLIDLRDAYYQRGRAEVFKEQWRALRERFPHRSFLGRAQAALRDPAAQSAA